jgi:hypothetical protein
MNEIYLIITGIIALISVVLTNNYRYFDYGVYGIFISACLAILTLAPIGDKKVETTIGKNTRVGNEFIISSKFPTQIATHVGFDGQEEVIVKRITERNAWGGVMTVSYKISTK